MMMMMVTIRPEKSVCLLHLRCTRNFQGQRVKGQGHRVIWLNSIKNAIIQARINCRRSNLVKTVRVPRSYIEIAITPPRIARSIAFKFGTEFHHVTGDTLQSSRLKVKGQRLRSQRIVMYQQQKRYIIRLQIWHGVVIKAEKNWRGSDGLKLQCRHYSQFPRFYRAAWNADAV